MTSAAMRSCQELTWTTAAPMMLPALWEEDIATMTLNARMDWSANQAAAGGKKL